MKLYFYHEQWNFDKEGKICAFSFPMTEELSGVRLRIFISEADIDLPENIKLLPESEIKQIMITGLRQEAKELQAETHKKLQAIEEKIQQLLCLEYKESEPMK